MLRKNLLLQLSFVALALMPQAMKAQFNWPYKNVNGTLVTDVPQRDAGQQPALNLVTPKMKAVRVASACADLVPLSAGPTSPA